MTNDITYEPILVLQSYTKKVKATASSIENNYAIRDDVALSNIDFQERNEMIRTKFFEGYSYAKQIINSDSDTLKSELEKMVNDIPNEELFISGYGNLNFIDSDEFKKDLLKAYIGGSRVAYKKPYLSEKERHEALIKMVL